MKRIVLLVCAAVAAAVMVRADVYTWSGGSDKWTTLANWKVAGAPATKLPGADDDVILPAPFEAANSYTVKASEAIAVRSFLIGSDDAASDCTATFESQTTAFHQIGGDLTVKAGGILTHTALASSVTTLAAVNRKLNMSVGGAATIEARGKINVKGCGFYNYNGPGAYSAFLSGSCHGGSGNNCTKHCYGSIRRPVDPGSHVGGGVVCLDVASTLTIDGEINADGNTDQSSSGSILLLASGVYGGGKVYSRKMSYAGGGRIAIIQRSETEMTFTGTVDCGNGSYYLENASDEKDRGELKVSKKSCLLHPEVTDAQEPFSKVTVESGGALEIESGVTLCCTDALTVKGTLTSVAGGGALVLSPKAGQPFAFDGVVSVKELVCTNEDAAISFADGSKMSVLDNGVLRLLGAEGHHLSLLAEDPATWTLEIGQMVDAKVEYADVKNGNATVLVADLGGSDLGGNNANWTFPRMPQIGDVITWVGGVSADWGDAMNWLDQDGTHRLPAPTDRVELNAGSGRYPLLTSDKSIYDLAIATGASLTLQGGNLAMARDLVCAGTLTCSGSETVSAGGTVSFVGGTFVRSTSTLVLTGTGPAAQSVNFGGSDVYQLVVRSTAVSFAGGFSAYGFSCLPTGACALVFSAGDLYAASGVRLVPGAGALTLDSSVPGTKWRFKVGPGAACDGVSVADCDASEGSAIHTVDFIDRGGNVNWTKGASTWLGGTSTDWGEPANWQGGVPTEETDVVIFSGTKQPTLKQPTCIRSLSIGGRTDAVTLTLSAELAVRETAFVGNNATVVIDKPMSVTNDFTLGNGGTLTHSKNASEQLYTLDLFVGGNMTVEPQGVINVKGCGFAKGTGPGGHTGFQTGASYGGWAGNTSVTYGSIRRPTDLGSGGNATDGNGGGAVALHVDGELLLDGSINADGNGSDGSGSGGSVWVVASALKGSGRISCVPLSYSSGGRISVVQRKANDLSAFTGAGGTMSWDNGTCYVENANDEADRGELKISGSSISGKACSLSTRMTDEDVPFGKVTIAAGRTLNIEKGVILRSTGDVLASGTLSSATDGGGLELLPSAGSTVTVQGVMAFHTFICTNKDATVCFTDGSKITVRDNGTVWLSGEKGHLTTLLAPTAWELSIGSSVDAVIQYIAASNSTASAAKVSDLGGRDLGGNANWEFPRAPEPGDTITWTGKGTADWGVADNWTDEFGDHRLPLETDRIVIGADAAPYPVVTASKSAMSFTVVEGASFTLDGADLTVAEYLTCAGTLTCRGPETITVGGAVSFVGGTFVRGTSTIVLAGTDVTAQSVNFAGRELYNLDVRAQLVSFAGGFSAYGFTCEQAGAVALVFSAGDLYAASGVRLVPGADASLALDSSVPGTKWRFKVGPGAVCDGVSVADCDASEGSAIHTVDFIDRDGNVNWTKGASTWLGGTSTAWNDPENWKGGVPTNTTDVVILSGANAPKLSSPTCIQSLSIGGGTDAITLTLSAELAVRETAFVGNNATVVIDKPMSVTNDFTLGNGGTLTHSKNASTQLYTLDLFVGGNMTVEPQGTINVEGCGFKTGNNGPGGGSGYQTGGVYAGGANYNTKKPYGSIRRPTDLGSGGNSGDGGGAVKLRVDGVLTLDGQINANGTGGAQGGGSGTGGSVWIVASALTGSGSISCTPKYYSSGGRISIVQRKANDLSAFTGAGGKMSWDNGTCYIENANDAPDRGELKISGSSVSGYACSLSTRMTDEDVPFGKVTIAVGRTLNIETGVTLSTYAGVAGGGSITSAADGGGLDVLAFGDTVAEVAGDVSVFSFVCTNGASEVEFAAGKTVTVADNGTLWLEGLSGRKTRLRSSVPGTQWKIAAGKNLTGKVRYLDVRDSSATGEPIRAKGSIGKKANNDNWIFPSGFALIVK